MKLHFEDFIYGSIDGAVTTFAVIAGVVGASLSPTIILILGFANLFADGFSMAAANFQSAKARNQFIEMKRKQEEWEIDNKTEQEKDEIREIYKKKGFKDEFLEEIVRIITSRRKVWVDTMMKEELGLIDNEKNPLDSSVSTFIGFNIVTDVARRLLCPLAASRHARCGLGDKWASWPTPSRTSWRRQRRRVHRTRARTMRPRPASRITSTRRINARNETICHDRIARRSPPQTPLRLRQGQIRRTHQCARTRR